MRRELAGEDLGSRPWVGVIARGILQEPLGRSIVVLIDEIGADAAQLLPQVVELLAVGERPCRSHELDFGVLLLQHAFEFGIPFDVLRPPLFVAHADILQVERRRVPERRALASPLGGLRTVGELDQIERVLDVRVELIQRNQFVRIELAGHAAVEYGQRRGADVLRQLEVLVKAQSE
jgi:hypothetical protein